MHEAKSKASENSIPNAQIRAIIGPHAGYMYCGTIMAYAYKYINPRNIKRVFLIGPSHHVYTDNCLLSKAEYFATPLGDLRIDQETCSRLSVLEAPHDFEYASISADESEHSLEMHAPFIVQRFVSEDCTLPLLVPIIVGALTPEQEISYGKVLAPYLLDSDNFFIISSDFCHWGSRFNFTLYDSNKGTISESIEWLDRLGMDVIESCDSEKFSSYIKKYGNTICGKHPIGVLLGALKHLSAPHSPAPAPKVPSALTLQTPLTLPITTPFADTASPTSLLKAQQSPSKKTGSRRTDEASVTIVPEVTFTRYAQSSRCKKASDSSVSYASAVVTFRQSVLS